MSEERTERVCVSFTMDVLPALERGSVRGPARWDDAVRAVAAFAEAVAAEGFGATLFVAPEAMSRLRRVLGDLRDARCELALLCHPQLSGYQSYLGSYGYDRQREAVSVARSMWEDVLGERTETFRPGFFSANDYTYHVLCSEGFRQGSCSLPGRMDGEQCSMWFGSYPYPHHTDPLDRTAQGSMEFFEVPVTSDFDAVSYMTYESYTPPHLRIEDVDVHGFAHDLVSRQLDRMVEDEVVSRAIVFVTSNLVCWGKEDDPHVERLRNLCQMLREVADERGEQMLWLPLSEMHKATDEEIGMPVEDS